MEDALANIKQRVELTCLPIARKNARLRARARFSHLIMRHLPNEVLPDLDSVWQQEVNYRVRRVQGSREEMLSTYNSLLEGICVRNELVQNTISAYRSEIRRRREDVAKRVLQGALQVRSECAALLPRSIKESKNQTPLNIAEGAENDAGKTRARSVVQNQ